MGATKSAWHLAHRLRAAAVQGGGVLFEGPVEVDETYLGGKEANKHANKKLHAGRGTVGKAAVAGIKDRETNQIAANVVSRTDGATLKDFVREHTADGARVYTDEARAYEGLPNHESVSHSAGEYVNEMAHTQGIERSAWALGDVPVVVPGPDEWQRLADLVEATEASREAALEAVRVRHEVLRDAIIGAVAALDGERN